MPAAKGTSRPPQVVIQSVRVGEDGRPARNVRGDQGRGPVRRVEETRTIPAVTLMYQRFFSWPLNSAAVARHQLVRQSPPEW
jgi:hypothetical protein